MCQEREIMEEEKYILNPYLKLILCSEDEILVRSGIRSSFSKIIQDENQRKLMGKIIKHFKEPTLIQNFQQIIEEEKKEDVITIINFLYQEGVLIKQSKDINKIYLESILKGKDSLSQKTIGVIGAGYLGQRIIKQLLRLGVKNIIFYDERKVKNYEAEKKLFEIDNFFSDDIFNKNISKELSYTDLLREYFTCLGFSNNIKSMNYLLDDEDKLKELFQQVDFTIAGFEFFSSRNFHFINQAALATRKPWVSVYVDGSQGVIGPFYIPSETLCYNEFEIQKEASIKLKDEYSLYKEYLDEEGNKLFHPIFIPFLEVISNFVVILVIKFLIKKETICYGRSIFINLEDMSIDYQDVLRLPRCPACKNLTPTYRHNFI